MLKQILLLLVATFASLLPAQEAIPPAPRGGQTALQNLLANEMYYPPDLLAEKQEATVRIRVSISATGELTEVEVEEGPRDAFVSEAHRLLRYVVWEPALRDGKTVQGDKRIEIEFNARKYKRTQKQRGYDRPPSIYQPADTSFHIYKKRTLDQQFEVFVPEGYAGMADFIRKNLQYPELALKRGLSGKVTMDMVVESSGRITNLNIISSVGAGCDEEALRLLRMLRFRPGIKDGIYVRSNIQFNIIFALPDEAGYRYFPAQQGGSMQ